MTRARLQIAAVLLLLAALVAASLWEPSNASSVVPPGREEVVFWHFWGGEDQAVVNEVVARFNASQETYYVRPVLMPGNNLDLKVFLSVSGGDSPDIVNQDDPVIGDWAYRGAIYPLDELASSAEMEELATWLYPAARQGATYEGRLYGLCNGLDIRALYYNRTLLDEYGLEPPQTLADLDQIAAVISPPGEVDERQRFGYLPDPRRLWVWGTVFGGDFYDESTGQVTADEPQIVAALQWMVGYSDRYGAAAVAFRGGDQSLPGNVFPLLAGRYAVVLDGQWRVRDILAYQATQRAAGEPVTEFGVCALPPPPGGRTNAGWVNGNYFLVPRSAKNPRGAWEFMKFWSGLAGNEHEAALTCKAGGWIPASPQVVAEPAFQDFLNEQPLFQTFVELAGSPNERPTPVIPGAAYFYDRIQKAGSDLMYRQHRELSPQEYLEQATRDIQRHLDQFPEPAAASSTN